MEELTFGQKAVGINFNVSGDENVHYAKKRCAEIIDNIEETYKVTTYEKPASWMKNVLRTAAINAIIAGQMAAVKFLTWKD